MGQIFFFLDCKKSQDFVQATFLIWSRFCKSSTTVMPTCHQNSDQSLGFSKSGLHMSEDAPLCHWKLHIYIWNLYTYTCNIYMQHIHIYAVVFLTDYIFLNLHTQTSSLRWIDVCLIMDGEKTHTH